MKQLDRRRRFLREKICGLIAAIDSRLQNPDPPVIDLYAKLDLVHDKPMEIQSLDAEIQNNLTWDNLKDETAVALVFEENVRSFQMRVLLHAFGRAAMKWISERYV